MLLFQKLILIIKISTSQDFKSTFNYNLTCIFLSLSQIKKTTLPSDTLYIVQTTPALVALYLHVGHKPGETKVKD